MLKPRSVATVKLLFVFVNRDNRIGKRDQPAPFRHAETEAA